MRISLWRYQKSRGCFDATLLITNTDRPPNCSSLLYYIYCLASESHLIASLIRSERAWHRLAVVHVTHMELCSQQTTLWQSRDQVNFTNRFTFVGGVFVGLVGMLQ